MRNGLWIMAALPIWAGCGALAADNGKAEPLAVIRGQVSNELGVMPEAEVRVALVWGIEDAEVAGYIVDAAVQEAAIAGSFPARFAITLDGPPPAAAVTPLLTEDGEWGGLTSLAMAELVVYADTNGNQHLDLGSSEEPPVDAILSGGFDTRIFVYYVAGDAAAPSAEGMPAIPRGFSLLSYYADFERESACDANRLLAGCDQFDIEDTAAVEVLPMTAEVNLRLTDIPHLSPIVCDAVWGATDSWDDEAPGTSTCDPDGRGYVWKSCYTNMPVVNELCGWCDVSGARVPDGEPLPDGWAEAMQARCPQS